MLLGAGEANAFSHKPEEALGVLWPDAACCDQSALPCRDEGHRQCTGECSYVPQAPVCEH